MVKRIQNQSFSRLPHHPKVKSKISPFKSNTPFARELSKISVFKTTTQSGRFQNLFLARPPDLLRVFFSERTWTMNVLRRVFPCITNKWPLQNHLLSKTIPGTPSVLSPGKPEQWLCRAQSSPLSQKNSLFKTIFQVEVYHQLDKLCLLGEKNK